MGFRHVVLLLTFAGVLFCYLIRASFSVALVSMVKDSKSAASYKTATGDRCSGNFTGWNNQTHSPNVTEPDTSTFGATYDWNTEIQSFMLGALFYGCLLSQMPSGMLVQHFGIKLMFGLTSLVSSALSLLTPVASSWGSGVVIAIRAAQGVLQGMQAPIVSQVVSKWHPSSERTRAFSFITTAPSIGNIAGMSISGLLAASKFMGGWPSIFYVFGFFGCVWSVAWIAFVSNTPQEHKCVSDNELKIILKDKSAISIENAPVPWKAILTSPRCWSFSFAVVGQMTALFAMMTELPLYLSQVFHFDIASSGALSAVPFLTRFIVTLVVSYIADILKQNGKLSITFIRKMMNSIGTSGVSFSLVAIAFVGCRTYLIIGLLCIASGFNGVSLSGSSVTAVELCPSFAAALSGIAYTLAYAAGALMPYIFGLFTRSGHTEENWSHAFLFCAALIFAANIQFIIFGSAEREPWDAAEQKDENGTKNQSPAMEQTEQIESTKL